MLQRQHMRRNRASSLSAVQSAIISCEQCPRLRTYCREVGRTRKASFRNDLYWARPVPGFGDPNARVLLLGLAPAAHGANRTGRIFTGDGAGASGDFLMAALNRAGFANIATSQRVDDGLKLTDVYIAATVRCAPPANKPLPEEVDRCLAHLDREITHLPNLQVVVALGKIAWDAWFKLLALRGVTIPKPKPVFGHGAIAHLSTQAPQHPSTSAPKHPSTQAPQHPSTPAPQHPSTLVGAYHPSRQNTNTGVVTPAMYDSVFRTVRESLR
jgi:uracil-DNA glycosylase family 4